MFPHLSYAGLSSKTLQTKGRVFLWWHALVPPTLLHCFLLTHLPHTSFFLHCIPVHSTVGTAFYLPERRARPPRNPALVPASISSSPGCSQCSETKQLTAGSDSSLTSWKIPMAYSSKRDMTFKRFTEMLAQSASILCSSYAHPSIPNWDYIGSLKFFTHPHLLGKRLSLLERATTCRKNSI